MTDWKAVLKEEFGFGQFPEKEVPKAKALLYTIFLNEGREAAQRAKEYYFISGNYWALYDMVSEPADVKEDYKFPDTLPDGTKIDWDAIF